MASSLQSSIPPSVGPRSRIAHIREFLVYHLRSTEFELDWDPMTARYMTDQFIGDGMKLFQFTTEDWKKSFGEIDGGLLRLKIYQLEQECVARRAARASDTSTGSTSFFSRFTSDLDYVKKNQ